MDRGVENVTSDVELGAHREQAKRIRWQAWLVTAVVLFFLLVWP